MDHHQKNDGFGPLLNTRGIAARFAAFFVVAFSVAVHFNAAYYSEQPRVKLQLLIFGAALLTLSLLLSEVVRRMCLVIEEIRHRRTRYKGSWMEVLKYTFTFRYGQVILVVGMSSFLIVSYFLYEHCNMFCRSEYAMFFSLNCFMSPQLLFLVGWRELSSVEVSMINERDNNTIGGCLAWSYYFDYLKLVLPQLDERIRQSVYRYDIRNKKLFILLPKNCYTYATIQEADARIKVAGNLGSYEINRGGICRKPYKNTIHRIEMPRPDGEIDVYYLVLEYAFPLMSLFEMSQHVECGLSRRERDEQVTFSLVSEIQSKLPLVDALTKQEKFPRMKMAIHGNGFWKLRVQIWFFHGSCK